MIPSKTYSRKRKRALAGTDSSSTSSPSPAAPASSKNIQDMNREFTTRIHNASGLTEAVSPERPSKKMKRHSSSTAMPSTRVPQSPLLHSAMPSELLAQAKLASFNTKSSHPGLLLRKDNDLRLQSTSEHIKTSTSSLHQTESGLKQSSAGQRLPFKRTRSQTQKENVLAHPQTLGSPFQIAPSSSLQRHISGTKAAKQLRSSKFIRRPSADVFRAHTSPVSFRRRPSGSHALQKRSTQNQDWLVARIPPSTNGNAAALDPDIDINKSHSFFSPQGSSTPLPLRHPIHYGTPMTPTPSIPSGDKESSPRQPQDIVMSNTTLLPEEGSVQTPGLASGLYSSPRDPSVIENGRQIHTQPSHRILHLQHDSIFSSFDVSASATTVRVLVDPLLARDEVVEKRDAQFDNLPRSIPERTENSHLPGGNKLHDMFSVLALAEKKKLSQDSAIDMNKVDGSFNVEEMRGANHDCGLPQNKGTRTSKGGLTNEKPIVYGEKTLVTRKRQQKPVAGSHPFSTSADHKNALKHGGVQVCIDNEPLTAGDDEDDELLLTSKGWDWDPQ